MALWFGGTGAVQSAPSPGDRDLFLLGCAADKASAQGIDHHIATIARMTAALNMNPVTAAICERSGASTLICHLSNRVARKSC
jgi:hypothetical protein